MQSSKKKILKIVGLILLIIVVGAGWWAADFFLIPKAQQKGVIAPVDPVSYTHLTLPTKSKL